MNYLFKILIIKFLLFYYSIKGYGVIIYNYFGCILDINKKASMTLGYKKKEIQGKNFLDLLPDNKISKNLIYFKNVISHANDMNSFNEQIRKTKRGSLTKMLVKPVRFKKFQLFISVCKH